MRAYTPKSEVVFSTEERVAILAKMAHASHTFYALAVHTHCHPFIEFCGLLNEYIKLCEKAHEQGIDFTQANVHSGQSLPMQCFHAKYLSEKLGCIFGPSLHNDPKVAKAFLDGLGFGSILPSQDEGLDSRAGTCTADDHA